MDDFEQQLKRAMARKDAPDAFAAKVLAVAAVRQAQRLPRTWRLRWATAALASVMFMGGVVWQRERIAAERARGEAAKAKLELALKITRTKLRRIESQLEAVQERN